MQWWEPLPSHLFLLRVVLHILLSSRSSKGQLLVGSVPWLEERISNLQHLCNNCFIYNYTSRMHQGRPKCCCTGSCSQTATWLHLPVMAHSANNWVPMSGLTASTQTLTQGCSNRLICWPLQASGMTRWGVRCGIIVINVWEPGENLEDPTGGSSSHN